MAIGDRVRQSTQRVRQIAEQKQSRISNLRQKVESIRGEMDRLIQLATEWEREMLSLQQDFQELEKFAQEIDSIERKLN